MYREGRYKQAIDLFVHVRSLRCPVFSHACGLIRTGRHPLTLSRSRSTCTAELLRRSRGHTRPWGYRKPSCCDSQR
jgi:hypothetical protein